jgi:hypothetical protein
VIKPWLREHRKVSRAVVMERAKGRCESCGRQTTLEWDHTCGRRNLVSEPWASSPYLTVALCRYCHRQATDELHGVREFTRSICLPALIELAKAQGVGVPDNADDYKALDMIRYYVRYLEYPDAG